MLVRTCIIFHFKISQLSRLFGLSVDYIANALMQFQKERPKISRSDRFLYKLANWSFHVVDLQRTATKFPKV